MDKQGTECLKKAYYIEEETELEDDDNSIINENNEKAPIATSDNNKINNTPINPTTAVNKSNNTLEDKEPLNRENDNNNKNVNTYEKSDQSSITKIKIS